MTTPDAKRIADKYIGRNGGAPEPTRVGGEFLAPENIRHVATLFEFSEAIITKGPAAGFPHRGDIADAASQTQKALAQLLDLSESDLRSAVAPYLRMHRP